MASRNENVQLNHGPPSPRDASTTKRQRLPDIASSPRAISRVFDVETLLQGLLAMLDLSALASLVEVLAADTSWRGVLSHDQFWKEMLTTHFGGNLPPAEQFNDNEDIPESSEEDEDEEREEEENEDEPDLIEIVEVDVEMDDDVSLLGDEEEIENEDDMSDVEIIPRPRATRSVNQTSARSEDTTASVTDTIQAPAVAWIDGLPSKKFDAQIQIIRGDIGEIQTVGEKRVDGLAFPTSSFLRNPHTGAASVIFRRAGQGLTDYIPTLGIQLDLGEAIATPGFDAGVDKLIHCVGPSGFNPNCLRDLQRTYRSVLRCIEEENLSCVAMASISTGNMGLPVDNAAWFALCAIQRYIRSTDWTATVAVVCFDADVYAAFTKCKRNLMGMFNDDTLRAIPPLQSR
ncbi:hypothetical protein PInf_018436 [Phytophthora infestans]|nr:hypothetical protein PInf_018436 [Phytophthora infestans]